MKVILLKDAKYIVFILNSGKRPYNLTSTFKLKNNKIIVYCYKKVNIIKC